MNHILLTIKKGFFLANKHIDVFIISTIFFALNNILTRLETAFISLSLLFLLLQLLLIYIDTGYTVSIPKLLAEKEQKNKLAYRIVRKTILENAKRMVVPFIGILGILTVFALIVREVAGFEALRTLYLLLTFQTWSILSVLISAISAFFVFTSIYFSIEKQGFFTSLKKSVLFSFKNIQFILVLIIIDMIVFFLLHLISANQSYTPENLLWTLRNFVTTYYFYIITATALLYYQHKKKD